MPRCFNRLVCRVADHPDAGGPRDPHRQDPLHPEPRELAADADDAGHHGHRRVVALLAARAGTWLHRLAAALLAVVARDAALLCRSHAGGEDVADPQNLAVDCADDPRRGEFFPR